MRKVIIRLLKRYRLYSQASWVYAKWDAIQPWGLKKRYNLQVKKMLSFYAPFVKEGDLCFDIGANMGNRTDVFRSLGATVISVEPQEVCLKQLRRKYSHDERVTIIPKAIGSNEGTAEIITSSYHPELSSISPEYIRLQTPHAGEGMWNGRETVGVTTLDKLIQEYGVPAFIKIDVEGYEFEVLKGLSQPVKAMSVEFITFHPEPAVNAIKRMSILGFTKFNYSIAETMEWSLDEWVGADEVCELIKVVKCLSGDVYGVVSLEDIEEIEI